MADDMTDFFDSQAKQAEAAPQTEAPAAPKNGRKKRKKRTPPTEAAVPMETPTPKKERKKRTPRAAGERKPRSAKVLLDVAITALAGLKPDEAQMVAAAAGKLGAMPKRSRGRIVAALARMFV